MSTLAQQPPEILRLLTGAGSLVAACMGAWGFILLKRVRTIEDTPTSRLRSAAQGYVELEGRARLMPGDPIYAPLSRANCVWWRYRVCKKTDRSSSNKNTWEVVREERSDSLFLLDDGTGTCIVNEDGATVTPTTQWTWYGDSVQPSVGPKAGGGLLRAAFCQYRYTEEIIPEFSPLYALGWYCSQVTAVNLEDENIETRELMKEWKSDPRKMKAFDVNKDGIVDAREWEAARRMAVNQVRQRSLDKALDPNLNILGKPPDRRPFLLAGRTQADVIRSLNWGVLGSLMFAGACVVFAAYCFRLLPA